MTETFEGVNDFNIEMRYTKALEKVKEKENASNIDKAVEKMNVEVVEIQVGKVACVVRSILVDIILSILLEVIRKNG